jgi:hypothetical protein
MGAGYLYEPNNYDQMYEQTLKLVQDEEARRKMGSDARDHVARLGWLSAIRRIRNEQYARAIGIFRAHKRCGPLPPFSSLHSPPGSLGLLVEYTVPNMWEAGGVVSGSR